MGFNLSGIVINENLQNQTNRLSEILKVNLEMEKEINFEIASSNYKEEGIIDVYFGQNGTLIFAHEDLCTGEELGFEKTKILTFSTSESTMSFYLSYSVNNRTFRNVMEFENEKLTDDGEKLDFEEDQETSELVWDFISYVLGEDYWGISESDKTYRFAIVQKDSFTIENFTIDKFDFLIPISMDEFQSNYSQDDWLELWNQMMDYAKTHTLNIFQHPSKFQGNHHIFMVNLLYLKNTLSNHPDLMKIFHTKIPINAFNAIGKAYSIQIDEESDERMKELIQVIPPISRQKFEPTPLFDKKWWEFWR